ncbi:type III ribulose-bisphosphate carboxylase [Natrinema gelatinilyticum]|uniref:type III ribulose-bisphosphate carboxylase n=1 Tax=Natrinema gelatinilyticum TaxID=2961571 RepID=UPI0020C29B78|nr:type III ribulose-bisphosphate carboxylase [Natrinema gelatinilyticum]
MTGIEYDDFLDLEYEPVETELVCEFAIEPAADMSMEAAASRVASESSNGTWAALHVDENELTDLGAVACDIDGSDVTVAYPVELFEAGSMPQILSCIAGNILGMKAVDSIRLENCRWPKSIVDGFPGPKFGTSVAREKLDAGDRPVLATVPKPKVGLSTDAHVKIGEAAWRGGIDLLKDDENLTDQGFNPFVDRLAESLAARDRVQEDTGERKDYLVNVTAETTEMLERVDLVAEHGGGFVMVDVITCGWAAVQSVRDRCEDHGLAIHAHRAMHAAFDRVDHHGVSMRVIAQIARLCGVDHIHTGTAGLGKLENEDTPGINAWLTGACHGLNPVLPVASGGLHPGVVDQLIDTLGTDIVVQAGGGVHGHPDGTLAGANALRQSVDATMADERLVEYAEDHQELATALEKWGSETPR